MRASHGPFVITLVVNSVAHKISVCDIYLLQLNLNNGTFNKCLLIPFAPISSLSLDVPLSFERRPKIKIFEYRNYISFLSFFLSRQTCFSCHASPINKAFLIPMTAIELRTLTPGWYFHPNGQGQAQDVIWYLSLWTCSIALFVFCEDLLIQQLFLH